MQCGNASTVAVGPNYMGNQGKAEIDPLLESGTLECNGTKLRTYFYVGGDPTKPKLAVIGPVAASVRQMGEIKGQVIFCLFSNFFAAQRSTDIFSLSIRQTMSHETASFEVFFLIPIRIYRYEIRPNVYFVPGCQFSSQVNYVA